MRAPDFWHAPPGLLAGMLMPAGLAWETAGRLRRVIAHPYRAPVPVVCVGNLVVGGAGKTPVALSLAALLRRRGIAIHTVTRGHGGRLAGPLPVDPARHDAAAVGDEALLHAAQGACWVGRDRAAAVRAAAAAGAGVILLDDGFQNPSVAKDLSLLVIDARYGVGNGLVMPAGPLREQAASGLARAHSVVLLDGVGETGGEALATFGDIGLPVLRARLVPVAGERFRNARVIAFAGIGRPQKFFAGLRGLGAELIAAHEFADHHPYRAEEIAALRREADRNAARLVTTEKDFVRLPGMQRDGIEVLAVEISWADPTGLARILNTIAGLPTPVRLDSSMGGDEHRAAETNR